MAGASWKSKYVYWYRIVESIFGTDVPHLTDYQIEDCVSDKDWIILPVAGERSKQDARKSQRPNLYFSLSEDKKVVAGITYDKIEGVRRFREIISPFNEKYRATILERLACLDDGFFTTVFRKTKNSYWGESPEYDEAFSQQSNKMNLPAFVRVFKAVDKIDAERDLLGKGKKYHLAPAINLVDITLSRDESSFKKFFSQMKPVYEVAVNVRTEEEFETEEAQATAVALKKKQQEFAKLISELQEKRRKGEITAEQYREQMMRFSKQT